MQSLFLIINIKNVAYFTSFLSAYQFYWKKYIFDRIAKDSAIFGDFLIAKIFWIRLLNDSFFKKILKHFLQIYFYKFFVWFSKTFFRMKFNLNLENIFGLVECTKMVNTALRKMPLYFITKAQISGNLYLGHRLIFLLKFSHTFQ